MNEAAYLLARARASRVVVGRTAAGDRALLEDAAAGVERRLVEVRLPGGGRGVIVRWAPEVEPVSGIAWDAETHRMATPTQLLTLGAALRLCWPNPQQPLYPGGAAAEEDVLAAAAPADGWVSEDVGPARQAAPYRYALRMLRAFGYLAADVGDGKVRLGPLVAAWGERDIDELRRGYTCLPGVESE
ncbi:hypothetical protein [Streptomyces sp. NPDC090798]|uniref:hypothetical protein n=1 Tax=Streptomyces sp. NPDC090798 TaxID=3365968 RepID=UPI0037F995C6